MKKLALIVAFDDNSAIGKGGKTPWHIPEDLKRFKELTLGRPVIMGRKTFESIGRCLPGRVNIVLTRDFVKAFTIWDLKDPPIYNRTPKQMEAGTDFVAVESFESALEVAYRRHEEPFVIGGAEIYKLALPLVTRFELTHVETKVDGADALLPEYDCFDADNFNVTFSSLKVHEGLRYQFCTAIRKSLS